MPDFRPIPLSSSVPCVETWWGLALQCTAGTQLTLVMRTLSTWGEAALALDFVEELLLLLLLLLVEAPPLSAVEVAPAACVPPASAALAGSARAASSHASSATAATAMNFD